MESLLGFRLLEPDGHGLDGPDDAAEDEVGVEDAERDLSGVLLRLADGRDDQADGGAGDALQHRQQEDPDDGTFGRNLETNKKGSLVLGSYC